MLTRLTKVATACFFLLILSFSNYSFAGDVYGKVGYGHYPIHVVIGYNGHNRHHGYRHHRYKKHYYVPRHRYYRHGHYYGHKARYYNPPRRYCPSRY